jgi:hypothetical protein
MMVLQMLPILGISLGMTMALELAFAVTSGKRGLKDLLLVCLVNVLTNPVVVLTYYLAVRHTPWNPVFLKIPLEAAAIFVEAHYYNTYGKGFGHPLRFSICANLFSFAVGEIYNAIGG